MFRRDWTVSNDVELFCVLIPGRYRDAIASYERCLKSVDVDDDLQLVPIHAKMTKTYNAAGEYTMGATHSLKIIDFCEHQGELLFLYDCMPRLFSRWHQSVAE